MASSPAAVPEPGRLPRVLFITGMGRSGSTVLDRVAGSTESACSVGELRWIWQLGFIEDQFCGCGERFSACPFWTAAVRHAFGAPAGVDAVRQATLQDRLLRMRAAPFAAARRLPTGRLRHAFREFDRTHRRLYAAIAAVSGASLVVDSSKYPGYGAALRAMPGLEVRTVHLVRDSRGVAYSIGREARDPALEGRRAYRYSRSARTTALNWLSLNVFAEALQPRRRNYLRLRYEDFARAPASAVRRVLDFAGLAAAPNPVDAAGTFDGGVQHTVAGNPMRLDSGRITIRPDLAWQRDLPAHDRRVATALTWPLLLRYGYSPSAGARQ